MKLSDFKDNDVKAGLKVKSLKTGWEGVITEVTRYRYENDPYVIIKWNNGEQSEWWAWQMDDIEVTDGNP